MQFTGENGAVFDIDPDCLRPAQRESHDAAVAAGRLVAVPVEKPKRTPVKKD